MHESFWESVDNSGVKVIEGKPGKVKPIILTSGPVKIEDFVNQVIKGLGPKIIQYPGIMEYTPDKILEAIQERQRRGGHLADESTKELRLFIDPTEDGELKDMLYCVTAKDLISKITGAYFLARNGIPPQDAAMGATPAKREYLPWEARGLVKLPGEEYEFFNSYNPPKWKKYFEDDRDAWKDLPDTLPGRVKVCMQHMVPSKSEREYLWAWTYVSMTRKTNIALLLTGDPGVGKNRFKLLLKALHGLTNSADGREETLGARNSRFNSQLQNKTLAWFDEVTITAEMENRIKEALNESISFEGKGVNATDSSRIFADLVFSNNRLKSLYIPFNSRKFAALELNTVDMSHALPKEVLDATTHLWDENLDSFSCEEIGQTAKWILKNGPRLLEKFPGLRYRGPKLLEIMHAGLSKWQHESMRAITDPVIVEKCQIEGRDGISWFKLLEVLKKKKQLDRQDYRDPLTVKDFFDNFLSKNWEKEFETEKVNPDEVGGDFLIRRRKSPLKVTPAEWAGAVSKEDLL